MDDVISTPFFEGLAAGVFKYGTVVLLEFQPHSLWYDCAYTIAAQAVKRGVKTDFHTFQHPPVDVRRALGELKVDVGALEKSGLLRIIDSYTVQVGLGESEVVEPYGFTSRS